MDSYPKFQTAMMFTDLMPFIEIHKFKWLQLDSKPEPQVFA